MTVSRVLVVLLISMAFGCGSNSKDNEVATNGKQVGTKSSDEFELLAFDKENLKDKFAFSGIIINGSRWKDKNGDNYIILTQVEKERTVEDFYLKSITLFAYHFADYNSGAYREVRKIQDFTKDCQFNNIAAFLPATLSVTDLDKDNFAEVTFVYKLGCKSERSPDEMKLIMMENGEKYAIRGETIVLIGDTKYGGKKEIDKSFNNAPQSFLNFAAELWDRNSEDLQE